MTFTATDPLLNKKVTVLGNTSLKPNETYEWTIEISIPENLPKASDHSAITQKFSIYGVIDGFGSNPDTPKYSLNIKHKEDVAVFET